MENSYRKAMKWLLSVSLVFLLIGVLGYAGSWWAYQEQRSWADETAQKALVIASQNGQLTLSAEQRRDIDRLAVEEELYEIYLMPVADAGQSWYDVIQENAAYSYTDSEKMERVRSLEGRPLPMMPDNFGTTNGTWGVRMEFAAVDWMDAGTTTLGFGVGVYWLLFCVWGTLKAFLQRRSAASWAVAYALFNVLAFLVFKINENKRL